MDVKADTVIDAKGLSCPIPLVRAKNTINKMGSDEVLEVQITDRGSINELNAWVRTSEHELVDLIKEENGVYRCWIRKK